MSQHASNVIPQSGGNAPPTDYVQLAPEPELWFQYWVGVVEIVGGIAAIITLVLFVLKWLMKSRLQRQAQPAADHNVENGIVLPQREARHLSESEERTNIAGEEEGFIYVPDEDMVERSAGTATRSTTMTYTASEGAVAAVDDDGETIQHQAQAKYRRDEVGEGL